MDGAKAGQVNCQICLNNTSKYSCPRCNVSYCGLKCYRAPCHSQCSEDFYKESVYSELKSQGKLDPQSKDKTLNILQKFRNSSEDDAELDSDDDDNLNLRLADIDLDDADSVWQALTPEERVDFQKKVDSGEIYKLVPVEEKTQTILWWEIYSAPKKVAEIGNDAKKSVLSPQLPPLTPPPTQIDVSKSSALVKFNIINVLAAYAMAYRHLYWSEKRVEKSIFANEILTLSTNLRSGENFTSAELAVTSVTSFMAQSKTYDKALISSVKKDVLSLIQGPGEGMADDLYILAALSDLKNVFDDDKGKRSTKKWKQICKKLDFYMCWAVKNLQLFRLE